MKHLFVLLMALLIPTAAMAKRECQADSEKFCKEIMAAKGDVGACLDQHKAELSDACKAKWQGSAKMGKGEETQSNSPTPENDTSKIDQPPPRNVPSSPELVASLMGAGFGAPFYATISRALSFAASQAVDDDLVAVHENDELSCRRAPRCDRMGTLRHDLKDSMSS